MDKIIEEIKNLKSMIQMVEKKVDEMNKTNQKRESNLEKLEKEVMKLNLKDLFHDNKINFYVLVSNTRKYPIIDDFLEEYYNTNKFIPKQNLLRQACFSYVGGLTNQRTIEILLKMGADSNCKLKYEYDILCDTFDYENNNFKGNRNYTTIGDLLFANGHEFKYCIFCIENVSFQFPYDENQIGYIDYCIQKIPKDDVKKIIIEIINDDGDYYFKKCKKILLERFLKAYPKLIR